jgi:hypothetical protein
MDMAMNNQIAKRSVDGAMTEDLNDQLNFEALEVASREMTGSEETRDTVKCCGLEF